MNSLKLVTISMTLAVFMASCGSSSSKNNQSRKNVRGSVTPLRTSVDQIAKEKIPPHHVGPSQADGVLADKIPAAGNEKVVPSVGQVVDDSKVCQASDFGPTSPPIVRLLEKSELDAVLRQAGIATGALHENLFSNRSKKIYQASPYEMWAADDASLLIDKLESSAAALANKLVTQESACSTASKDAAVTAACLDAAVKMISSTLFRRPPTPEMQVRYKNSISTQAAAAMSALDGLRFGFEIALQSVSLLYRSEIGESSPASGQSISLSNWEIAQALSFGISGTPPDSELQRAALAGELTNSSAVKKQAQRLVALASSKERIWNFYDRWLNLAAPGAVFKDATKYPSFNAAKSQAAYNELKGFVTSSLYSTNDPDVFKSILAGRTNDRSGVHTMKSFLATHSGASETNPVHLAETFLKTVACVPIAPPPPNALQIPFTEDPKKSPRQNFEAKTSGPVCMSCHINLNGVGFAFDKWDAIGEARTMHGGFPIDTSGKVRLSSGLELMFSGPDDLLLGIASQRETKACHTAWMFRYVRGHNETDADTCGLRSVLNDMSNAKNNPLEAIGSLYASPAFLVRKSVVK